MKQLWTAALPHAFRGSMKPLFDPMTNSVFVSDGWGAAFSSLSVRRFSLEDGSATGVVRVRAPVWSIAIDHDADRAVVAAGKKLVQLRRSDLHETARWERGIPRGSHHSAVVGSHAVLLGWAGPTMTILDFTTGACTRKRVGSCQALVPLSDGSVLVASGKQGTLSKCAPASGVVTKITSPGPFVQAAVSESASLVVVVPCDPAISAESWLYHDGIGHGLSLVQLNGWGRPRSVAAPSAFDGLWLSADGRRLILSHGSSVMLCEIDDLSVNLISRHELPSDVRAVLVIPELGLVLAADDRPDRGTLSAWQLSG